MCRDAGIPLKLAVLAVPVATDFSTYQKPSDSPFPSFTEFRKGAMLNWERMSFFGDCLFQTNEEVVRASIPRYWMQPLDAPNFSGLCETFLITAECDPVRDEGEAYGRKVHEAGAKVAFKRSVFSDQHSFQQALIENRYLGMPHPFMHMTSQLEQARQYDRDVLEALNVVHGRDD
jgi:acetyl esterase/lipase